MKHLEEYRDAGLAHKLLDEIRHVTHSTWSLIEICGGQTHAIMRHGLDQLLPPEIELIHGPGCPVCVTSLELVDKALAIASTPNVIFASYGDMLRVPGSGRDLFSVRADGGDIRIVYSPLDAIKIAQQNPDKQVVFFGIGFETTAPANAMSIIQARNLQLKNYSMLTSHVCVPPAMQAILGSSENRIQGFLAAGHVCAVMGFKEYIPIASQYHVPITITGFEPIDILAGILMTVRQLEQGTDNVENAYSRVVSMEGNLPAQEVIHKVFEVRDRKWRGIGLIPSSGWGIRKEFADFDAELRFNVEGIRSNESPLCISGEILQGILKPPSCSAFGKECTPEHPLGATMVSGEGACAAYYRYRQQPNYLREKIQ